ncbi:MAG: ATP-binding cassette domain-containing protein [Clostridia bacterium]
MQPQIFAEDLCKTYRVYTRSGNLLHSFFAPQVRQVKALQGVSFAIAQGELVGYIGPNGAGKSTTVKILSGILHPDGGTCQVLGMTPWKQRTQYVAHIGVVFGQRSQLWWDLPVRDSFLLLRDIYRVGKSDFARTQTELIDRLGLSALLDTPVRQLSLGQRMRCELAASLLHCPQILFLDEPTIGLDAVSKLAVRDFIREQNAQRGVTVILTTHDMDDIESLCSRVLLIGQGKLLLDGPVAALRGERDARILTAELQRPPQNLPAGVVCTRTQDRRYVLRFFPDETPTADLIALLAATCGIHDVMVETPSIEEMIAARYLRMGEETAL